MAIPVLIAIGAKLLPIKEWLSMNKTWIKWAVLALVVAGAFTLTYCKGKEAGIEETKAAQAAEEAKARRKAQASADRATAAADSRAQAETQRSTEERKRLDDAINQGRSPLDVLFGPERVQPNNQRQPSP